MAPLLSRGWRSCVAAIPAVATTGILLTASACDSPGPLAPVVRVTPAVAAQLPQDALVANERVQRFPLDFTFSVDCDGEAITAHVVGFFQVRTFEREGSRVLELRQLNILVTFTNAAGETFLWREVGPDLFRIDRDGNLVQAIAGRVGVQFGTIGRVVVDPETGELEFIAGRNVGLTEANACEALT